HSTSPPANQHLIRVVWTEAMSYCRSYRWAAPGAPAKTGWHARCYGPSFLLIRRRKGRGLRGPFPRLGAGERVRRGCFERMASPAPARARRALLTVREPLRCPTLSDGGTEQAARRGQGDASRARPLCLHHSYQLRHRETDHWIAPIYFINPIGG